MGQYGRVQFDHGRQLRHLQCAFRGCDVASPLSAPGGDDRSQAMIVECFARRIMAPFQGVLQLHHLSDPERVRLERAATRRARALARLFRLYPKTIDEQLIRVARVQTRMQASRHATAHYEEPFLWCE